MQLIVVANYNISKLEKLDMDATGAVSILALVLIIYMYTECSVDQKTN